jgi:threonine aldolase
MSGLEAANSGYARAYGGDELCAGARSLVADIFHSSASDVFFVGTGTAANVLSILIGTRRYQSVLTPHTAHIQVNEAASPEFITGAKLLLVGTDDGKLNLTTAARLVQEHLGSALKPPVGLISISMSTELGTHYSLDEYRDVIAFARAHSLLVHVDGARLSNAAVYANLSLQALTAGADILSFGLTKNGGMAAEAVVVLNPTMLSTAAVSNMQKQITQVHSKQRYQCSEFLSLLQHDHWLHNAQTANTKAAEMKQRLLDTGLVREADFPLPLQANMVYVWLPDSVFQALQRLYVFYPWTIPQTRPGYTLARFMTCSDTGSEDIAQLVQHLSSLLPVLVPMHVPPQAFERSTDEPCVAGNNTMAAW